MTCATRTASRRSAHRPRAPLLAGALLLAACAQDPIGPGPVPVPAEIEELPRALTISERIVSAATNRFAFDLLREVQGAVPDSSHFLSPLSASMALGMAMAGAEGNTFREMGEVLGFPGMDREEIGDAYRGLLDLLRGLDPQVAVEIGNSVWIREGFGVERSFLDFVRSRFDAHARELDFSDPSASGVINGWVSDRTRGLIPTIVPPQIDPLTRLFLINAIHFKGIWRDRFDPAATRDAPFHGVSESGTVPLMRREGRFPYRETERAQVVDLPYGANAWTMTVILPRPGTALGEIVASLDTDSFEALLPRSAPRGGGMLGEVLLPRFRMTWERTLNDDLEALGMRDAFDPSRADFTGIAAAENLHISRVLQKSFVAVDEEGTEAAAATSVEVGVTSVPQRFLFRADRPFLFVIRERLSGTILFVGTVVNPPEEGG